MARKPDPDVQRAADLIDDLETEDLSLDQRLALARTHALVSIARSLDSLDRSGIDIIQ
ncbi:hypothetical protein ACFVWG_14020 [Kribbella sp. NPDC058245]|uniref:hypothetical protein n=1 Tax=Kribbella sp. NPDC058245 TaxID=3346399 RepID=UPI0036E5186F